MPAGLRRRAKFHCLGFRYVGQNLKNMEFCGKNLPLRVGGQSHYAIFTKFDRTFMQTSLKCGLIAPKSPKLIILGINLPPKGIKRFLQNLAWERESQVRTVTQNFVVVALKCGLRAPKIGNFYRASAP